MLNRRDEKTMFDLIIKVANDDERIRAVILNGSRTISSAKKDIFQDYDIIYLVTEVEPFVSDKNWVKQFGDILIMQTPDEMDENWPKSKDRYAYLMQFKDWHRIDLTLLHLNKLATIAKDSQSILLLDKDHINPAFDEPSKKDYLPHPPTAKQFHDTCNEFLWVSTYVAKGLWRRELIYAKTVEQVVKEQLLQLLTWYGAYQTDYKISLGKFSRHLQEFIEPELWHDLLLTYSDANYENMWQALFKMCELFNLVTVKIANAYGFKYNRQEYLSVLTYLKAVKSDSLQYGSET